MSKVRRITTAGCAAFALIWSNCAGADESLMDAALAAYEM